MACYPGQPPPPRPEELDPLSDSEADYKDFSAVQQNCHSTQVIVKWLELNYHYEEGVCLPRSTIYEHYVDFCERENIQPVINAASFGKVS
jgi:regulatory factor X 4